MKFGKLRGIDEGLKATCVGPLLGPNVVHIFGLNFGYTVKTQHTKQY